MIRGILSQNFLVCFLAAHSTQDLYTSFKYHLQFKEATMIGNSVKVSILGLKHCVFYYYYFAFAKSFEFACNFYSAFRWCSRNGLTEVFMSMLCHSLPGNVSPGSYLLILHAMCFHVMYLRKNSNGGFKRACGILLFNH